MQKILDVNNLYVVYEKKTNNPFVGIKNFSYSFESGKIYCIVGQSGSGKSTLINCFNGLNPPDYGSLKIDDILVSSKKRLDLTLISKQEISTINNKRAIYKNNFLIKGSKNAKFIDINLYLKSITKEPYFLKKKSKENFLLNTNMSINDIHILQESIKTDNCLFNKNAKRKIKKYLQIRKTVGIVYQFPEFQLFKPTVVSDVSFGLINLKFNKEEAIEIAKKQLLKLGINETLFNVSPFCLSGGQKRKVALAGIFSIDPKIYVFDEPTAGLDPASDNEMLKYMLDFKQKNKCVIVVTHSMDDVLLIADEILVIHEGKLVKSGKPYDIFLDEKILENSRIELPLVIKMILNLIKKSNKFNKILEYEPRDVNQLADCIIKVIKGK